MESEYSGGLKVDYTKAAQVFSSEEAKGVLIFSIKDAVNLPPTSTSTLGGGKPYVLIGITKKLKDLSKLYAPSPSLAKTTIVHHNITHPYWNQELKIKVNPDIRKNSQGVQIQVWSYRQFLPDLFLGEIVLPWADIVPLVATKDVSHELKPREWKKNPTNEDEAAQGTLNLRVLFRSKLTASDFREVRNQYAS